MPGSSDQQNLLIAIALIALAIAAAVGLAFVFFRRDRTPGQQEEHFDGPGGGYGPISIDQDPILAALTKRIDEIVTSRIGAALEALSDSDLRIRADLSEVRARVEVLADGIRQGSKEIGAVEALLQDIVKILNISISESKSVSEKIQKHYGDLQKSASQPPVHRLGQPR